MVLPRRLAIGAVLTFAVVRTSGDRIVDGRRTRQARPPPPPPPNPCFANSTAEAQFHITNMGIGPHDANAIFQYKGVWHVMHQANWTDWAHLVSTDLATWTRLPSALYPNGDWDGSLTLMNGKPVIMFDCYNLPDCHPPNTTALIDRDGDGVGSGDPRIIGVAHPADLDDANLSKWKKDPNNPIRINNGTVASAGPSDLWVERGGTTNMVMQLNRAIGRFESTDPNLHTWTVADPDFFTSGGNGGHGATGVAFFPLPGSTEGDLLTHMLGGIWGRGGGKEFPVGCPWVYLGHYDPTVGKFLNSTAAQPLDFGPMVIWSTIDAQADGRILHVGWFNYGTGALTVPRSITYDRTLQALIAQPVAELATLRGDVLGAVSATTTVEPGGALAVFKKGATATAFDLEAEISLPAGKAASFGAAILASAADNAAVLLNVNVSAPGPDGVREVNMSASVPHATAAGYNATHSFRHPDAPVIALRVLADRMMVEIFVGGGRGAVTTPVLAPGKEPLNAGAYILAGVDTELVVAAASAWKMGCGWARYP